MRLTWVTWLTLSTYRSSSDSNETLYSFNSKLHPQYTDLIRTITVKVPTSIDFNFTVESIDSILTRRRTQFRIMIETMIATKKVIKNATKKIVMINLTTTRINLKCCVEIAKNAIIIIMTVKNHFKTIKIIKMIKTIKTWKKFKINRRNLRRTNSNKSRKDR
jgi:hypothetical protein